MIKIFSTHHNAYIPTIEKSEKELNKLVSDNFKAFFPELIFIKSEFKLEGVARSIGTTGRIDIFAFNSRTNKFVVFELKRDLNKNIRTQANDYKEFIEDNFSDIYISVLQDHDIQLPKKREIVSDSLEIILIAKEFSERDKYNIDSNEITFIKYMWFEGGLFLLQFLNNQHKNQTVYFKSSELGNTVDTIRLSKNSEEELLQNSIESVSNTARNHHQSLKGTTPQKIKPVNERLTIKNRSGAKASGQKREDGKFVVFAGSKISEKEAPKLITSAVNAYRKRRELKSDGIISENGVFIKDYIFNSVSLAAKVVLGTSADGTQWKNE